MPRLTRSVPAYRLHKASNRAVVTLQGRDHYLGPWKSPESKAEYDRLIGEWLAAGRGRPKADEIKGTVDPTVSEVLLAFWRHAETHYRDQDGVPTDELKNLKDALKPVRRLYGKTSARSFGPLALRIVRDAIWFGRVEPVEARVRLAYRLNLDSYNGDERLQMVVVAALAHGQVAAPPA